MKDYYPLVKKAFAYSRGIHQSNQKFKEVLSSLNSSLDELRSQYDVYSTQKPVNLCYEKELADAYLLGYVPTYIAQAKEALKFSRVLDGTSAPSKAAFFCCGPCPEGVAFMELLSEPAKKLRLSNQKKIGLEFYLFDRDETTWRTVANSLLGIAENDLWPGTIWTESYPLDLTAASPNDPYWLRAKEIVSKVDIVMLQNCFNEFGSRTHLVEEALLSIAESLPHKSKLLISELQRPATVDTFKELEKSLSKFGITKTSPIFPTHQVRDRINRNVRIPQPCAELHHTFFANQSRLSTIPRTGAHCIFLTLDRDRLDKE